MKKLCSSAFLALAFLLSPVFNTPARCDVNIQVHVNLPLPPLVIPAHPLLLPIPGLTFITRLTRVRIYSGIVKDGIARMPAGGTRRDITMAHGTSFIIGMYPDP